MTLIDGDDAIEWLSSTLVDGVRMGRIGSQIVVEWRGIGTFRCSASGAEGRFDPAPGARVELLEKFQATGLLACQRYLAGALSLHGSAVMLPGGAVVFIGDSSAGKSTTAMALVEKYGAAYLADDIVPIDWREQVPVVAAVDDSFWLAPDASSWFGLTATVEHKCAYPPRRRAGNAERLSAIVHLEFDESVGCPQFHPVSGHDSFLVLSEAHACYSISASDDALRNLLARARLASAVAIHRLRRPRTLDALGPAIQLLQERLSVGSSAPFASS